MGAPRDTRHTMKVIEVIMWTHKGEGEEATRLCEYADFSEYNYFIRGKVKEFADFASRTIVERTPAGMRHKVQKEDFVVYCRVRPEGLGCTVITDTEYEHRVAFGMTEACLDAMLKQYPLEWKESAPMKNGEGGCPCPEVEGNLVKFQNPLEADKITRMQKELDGVKEVLTKSIEEVLARGEKLDDLVAKSSELSDGSKAFYDTTKNQTSCCVV